jgi:nitrogen fixation protein FixH
MAAVMIAFFGTVIAVNIAMATLATRTFGGKMVENSYVASQKFNGWLARARAQEALGWRHELALDADRHLALDLHSPEGALDGAVVTGVARHPLGREGEVTLRFLPAGNGRYRTAQSLPAGRWYLHLAIARGTDHARMIEQIG